MSNPHIERRPGASGPDEHPDQEPVFPQANAAAVNAIAEVLESTLGPASRDKLVVRALETRGNPDRGQVAVDDFVATSDGATILEKLPLEHPIAPIVKRMVGPERPGETDVVGEDITDGVTTSVVFAGALLDGAMDLIENSIHPFDIGRGFHDASSLATAEIADIATPIDSFDDSSAVATAVARTSMTGNDVGGHADTWANIAVDAVDAVAFPTSKTLAVRQIRHGSIGESRLVHGAVLDRNARARDAMPASVTDASILVLGGHDRGGLRTPETPEEFTATVSSPAGVDAYDDVFDNWRQNVFERILAADVDVVVTELGIDDQFLDLLANNGIVGIRGVNRLDLSQVAMATGATIVKDPADVSAEFLGFAGSVTEELIDPREDGRKHKRMTVFDDCSNPASVSVLLRGVDPYLETQASTMIRKAAYSVAVARGGQNRQPGVVPGAGATDAYLATVIRDASTAEGSRAALAMVVFADALETVPAQLAKNGGGDAINTVAELRSANQERPQQGFILPSGEIGDPAAASVLDPAFVRIDSIRTGTAVANLLLRIDDAIDAEFTQDGPDTGEAIYEDEAERHAEHVAGE